MSPNFNSCLMVPRFLFVVKIAWPKNLVTLKIVQFTIGFHVFSLVITNLVLNDKTVKKVDHETLTINS